MAGNKFLQNIAGVISEVASLDTSAGAGDAGKMIGLDASGLINTNMMPVGIGADTVSLTAAENIAASDLIYIDATGKVAKADATTAGKEAMGFCLTAIASAATGDVYLGSGKVTGLTGMTAGDKHYLLATAGTSGATAPSTTGNVAQQVGIAVSATVLSFEPQSAITIA